MKQATAAAHTNNTSDEKQRLRVWLRVLKLQRQMEAELRERLRKRFDTTLPRFDVLAALDHHVEGLRMSELSSWLKVSNGNVTGIVDRLVDDGLVVRVPVEGDRRALLVRLTRKGREVFAEMASAHAGWVDGLLAGLNTHEADQLLMLLEKAARSSGEKP